MFQRARTGLKKAYSPECEWAVAAAPRIEEIRARRAAEDAEEEEVDDDDEDDEAGIIKEDHDKEVEGAGGNGRGGCS